jgi:hypothetical protein
VAPWTSRAGPPAPRKRSPQTLPSARAGHQPAALLSPPPPRVAPGSSLQVDEWERRPCRSPSCEQPREALSSATPPPAYHSVSVEQGCDAPTWCQAACWAVSRDSVGGARRQLFVEMAAWIYRILYYRTRMQRLADTRCSNPHRARRARLYA